VVPPCAGPLSVFPVHPAKGIAPKITRANRGGVLAS
jgi:hypothetical protein